MKKRIIFLLLASVLVLGGIVGYASLNRYQDEGELQLSGLKGSVRVVRDEKGMPYIYARTHLDATMAQGFISAQDRLFQMELTRRAVAGRLSEILGASMRETDIRNRTIGILRTARKHVKLLAPEQQLYLQRYVDGINAYIETRKEEHPLKIKLSGMKMEPWTPADSLSIAYFIGWGGGANLSTEIVAQSLVDKLGLNKAQEIFPLNINPDEDAGETNFARAGQPVVAAPLSLLADNRIKSYLKEQKLKLGSNAWATSPRFSKSGSPIVAGDPHLDARTLPGPIYPMGIITPQYRVVGAAFAGMPSLVISRNEYVATALTNGYGDTQDLYIETIDPQNPDNYLEGNQSIPFETVEEILRIKDKSAEDGYRDEVIKIKHTKRGPLVSDAIKGLKGDRTLSLRWSLAEGMSPALAMDGLLFAKSAEDINEVLKNWTMMSANWAFADTKGNIGFYATGRIPIRSQGESLLPYSMVDGSDNWIGWVPSGEMPHLDNPERGWVGSANHKIVDTDYPYYYSSYFSPSYRYQRLRELLDTPSTKTLEDHWQFQRDTKNMMAVTLAPLMTKALMAHADTQAIGKLLADWNFHDDIDLSAPVIFHNTYHEFAKLVFADELGEELSSNMLKVDYFWQERLEHMIIEGRSAWFDDTRTEQVIETRDDLFHRAAQITMEKMTEKLGEDPSQWRWGDIHQIEFTSPVRRKGFGKGIIGAGRYPFPGSSETLHRGIYRFDRSFDTTTSASLRMVADLGDTDKVLAVLPGGESGRLFDSHRNDQTEAFVKGDKRFWWFSDRKIEEHNKSEMILNP